LNKKKDTKWLNNFGIAFHIASNNFSVFYRFGQVGPDKIEYQDLEKFNLQNDRKKINTVKVFTPAIFKLRNSVKNN